ncbi:MAG: prepilin-type N-terminal cleavage/methylation domain-containing protein, partial [Deltaproteobacteria bacterium]|nr:prepilin-type N-terminal cleavage/methylation domain-containing protein [Deltaproteobacteria bacterium]
MMIRRDFKDQKQIHSEKGFTLLEILFATCILSVGLLAVASLQAAAIRGNYFADGVSNGST